VCVRLTGVVGQTPAGSHAGHASGKVIRGRCEADGGHVGVQLGGGGQLDQGDVVVDGISVPGGVGEHLRASRGWG